MHPLQPKDLFQLDRIGDPQISPNGEWVAYVRQWIAPETCTFRSDLWLVPADGSTPSRRLTTAGTRNLSPCWSPDGTRLAFLSNRDGKTQVWVLDLVGGEARQVTRGGAEPTGHVAWSPDSAQVVFAGWTRLAECDEISYPGAPAPDSEGISEQKARPRVVVRLDHKKDGTGHYGDRFRQLYICRLGEKPAEPVRTVTMEAHCDAPAWSPDGRYVAFVVTGEGDRHFFSGSSLYLLDVATGKARPVWQPGGYCSSPAWSPDSKRLALVADNAAAGPYCTTDGLWELDLASEQAVNLTAAFDREVGEAISSDWRHGGHTGPVWTPAGWLFLARSEGESHLFLTPGVLKTHGPMAVGGYSAGGGRLAYQASQPAEPDLIYVDGRVVARPDKAWDEMALAPARRFRFAGEGGMPMDGWAMFPEGDGPHPAALCIHGGPHNAYGEALQIQFQLLVGAGYAVVFVNPRGSQGYGQAFASAVCGDWGGADYQDLMRGLDAAIAMGGIDPERLVATGWSYGGYMTNRIVTETRRFKAAVSGACIANLHSFHGTSDIGDPFLATQAPGLPWAEPSALLARSPLQAVERVETPVLLLHGEDDLRCPISQSEEFYVALKRLGKEAVLVRYPGESHSFSQPLHIYDRHRRTIAWFDHYTRRT